MACMLGAAAAAVGAQRSSVLQRGAASLQVRIQQPPELLQTGGQAWVGAPLGLKGAILG